MLIQLVTIVHIITCILLIGLVLLQQGKGADMGAAFGGGSNTLFGASGAGNFLTKSTTVLAILFMTCSVVLAMSKKFSITTESSVFQFEDKKPLTEAPVEPVVKEPMANEPVTKTEPTASSPSAPSEPQVTGAQEQSSTPVEKPTTP